MAKIQLDLYQSNVLKSSHLVLLKSPILRTSNSLLSPSADKTSVVNVLIVSAFLISFRSSTHKPDISAKSGKLFRFSKIF